MSESSRTIVVLLVCLVIAWECAEKLVCHVCTRHYRFCPILSAGVQVGHQGNHGATRWGRRMHLHRSQHMRQSTLWPGASCSGQ
jgi:hypothetical protein